MHFIQAGLNLLNVLNMFFQNRPVNSPPLPRSPYYFRRIVRRRATWHSVLVQLWGKKFWNKRANKNKKHMCPFNTQSWPAQLGSSGEWLWLFTGGGERRMGHCNSCQETWDWPRGAGPRLALQSASCTRVTGTWLRNKWSHLRRAAARTHASQLLESGTRVRTVPRGNWGAGSTP